jgi:bifunctional UDP-N-acetylglucosamine pyrophosphorylase/glucosamine-1-phosphate N-acetyltransferase
LATAQPLEIVIMAAGKGTRMRSSLPKVLHPLAGRALLQHVLDTAAQLQARKAVVVTGHAAAQVQAYCEAQADPENARLAMQFVLQAPQLGTGHAVQQAAPALADDSLVLVLSGDVPLTQVDTLQALLAATQGHKLALLTLEQADPTGYGRIVRAPSASAAPGAPSAPSAPNVPAAPGVEATQGAVQAIVEHKDASPAQRQITEIYSGIMAAPAAALKHWLAQLDNRNAQGEFYLTDVVRLAVAQGVEVVAHKISDAVQVAGVNSHAQLADLERAYQVRTAQALMAQGVRLADPARLDVRGTLHCGQDVSIDINCLFMGEVHLGDGVCIGANCVVANARIEAGAVIHPFTHIDGEKQGVQIGQGARIGPFARLRPGAQLGAEVHIGNFVEVKNASFAAGAKANHLAYIGDASVGERVNYGAGSITANYDGVNKHHTVIEADVHVGSNCVLVAPLTLGAGGTIGGGSTLTKSTPAGALTVARGKQTSIPNWKRPAKLLKPKPQPKP